MLVKKWREKGSLVGRGPGIKIPIAVLALLISNLWPWGYCAALGERYQNGFGMEFIFINSGTFTMGSPKSEVKRKDDEEQHQIRVKGYYLRRTEVTQGQWQAVMGDNPSRFKDCGASCPVENVSWLDAQEFIKKLNSMDLRNNYRLPTEAKWEYGCRAGTTTAYSWGDEPDCTKANYGNSKLSQDCAVSNPGRPIPVGSYQANPWGLYDMHGNVWEWCVDRYGPYGQKRQSDAGEKAGQQKRVVRGGAYFDPAESCRTANRCWDPADYRVQDISLRLVRIPSP